MAHEDALEFIRSNRRGVLATRRRDGGVQRTVEGTVEILSLPEALEPLVDYYRLTSGEHPDWEDYRLAMHREHRVLVRMTVERSGPTRTG